MTQEKLKDFLSIYKLYPSFLAKAYVFIRSRMLKLTEVDNLLPKKGKIIDVGCGYGLVSYYLSLSSKQRNILGVDIDEKRIATIQTIFANNANLKFETRDLNKTTINEQANGIVVYDLLHHIDPESQIKLIQSAKKNLQPGGVLLIKEIDASQNFKTFFTWVLDELVTKFQPVHYRKLKEWEEILLKNGFTVSSQKLSSLLPYPHVLITCMKNE